MKNFNLPLFLAAIASTLTIALVTFFSMRSWHVEAEVAFDPEVTFQLPDTTVTYKIRDLPIVGNSIIVPSNDQSEPAFRYDQSLGTLTLMSSPLDYQIEIASLPNLATTTEQVQVITPNYQQVSRYEPRIKLYNARLNIVHRQPLIIKLKDGATETDLSLPASLLRQIIMPTSLDLSVPLAIDEPVLLNYIIPRLSIKQKEYFNLNATTANVKNALSERLRLQTTPVVLGVDDGPSSQGDLASKYLEVDLSQQKMYFFISGQLFKSYRISTGLDYPTPVGEFHVMNKAPLAFSGIYNAWMPYWMAFKYASDVGAYLGLHEKAYVSISRGKKIYAHDRQIGDKLTGGCIAFAPQDAKEIYDRSDVGMLVRIVP